MLKIKFWRIENVIVMKVLEQGDEIKRGCGVFFEHIGIKITSASTAVLFANEIYVKGTNSPGENKCVSVAFNSIGEAKGHLQAYIETIQAYNQSLTDDVEIEPFEDKEEVVVF